MEYVIGYFLIGILACLGNAYWGGYSEEDGWDMFVSVILCIAWPVLILCVMMYTLIISLNYILVRVSNLNK